MASASAPPEGGRVRRRRVGNAFHTEFLSQFDEQDNPDSAVEADLDGPWRVAPCRWHGAEGFGVFRLWEDPARDEPRAWFTARESALIAAALLPASGKDDWYELSAQSTDAGHRVVQRGELVGFLPLFEERLAAGLHFGECLTRSPRALASLLLACSPQALKVAGTMLAQALDRRAGEGESGRNEPPRRGGTGDAGRPEPDRPGEDLDTGERQPEQHAEGGNSRGGESRAPPGKGASDKGRITEADGSVEQAKLTCRLGLLT